MRVKDLGKASWREGESEIRAGKTHWKEIGEIGGDCGNGNEKMRQEWREDLVTRVEGAKEGDQDDLEKAKMMAEEGDQTRSRLITRSMASTRSSTFTRASWTTLTSSR